MRPPGTPAGRGTRASSSSSAHLLFLPLLLLLPLLLPSVVVDVATADEPDPSAVVRQLLAIILGEDLAGESDPDCLRSLTGVTDWLDATMAEDETGRVAVVLADFEYSINITEYNKKRTIELLTTFDEWFLGTSRKASEHLSANSHSLRKCGKTTKRMLEQYSRAGNLIPNSREKRKMLRTVIAGMEEHYSTGVVEKDGKKYRLEPELTAIMSDSRDYETLLWAWKEWHDLAATSKDNYTEMVNLLNEAATEHGFSDAGEIWRISDLEDPNADKILMELMEEMQPLYDELHAFVRARLLEEYYPRLVGTKHQGVFDPEGAIPAHLFGNMWAQQWGTLEDLLLPFPDATPPPNVTDALIRQNYTVDRMFRLAEEFFVSLGFQPMTDIFWQKSVLQRPEDPEVEMICHASAWDMTTKDDYRIKMCTIIDSRDLETVHHEMGHIAYYMEYRRQPIVFRGGGTPAFHEALGDTIALSVMSPRHLQAIGLVHGSIGPPPSVPSATPSILNIMRSIWEGDDGGEDYTESTEDELSYEEIDELEENPDASVGVEDPWDGQICDDACQIKLNTMMITALDKIAFLPFALSIELWRYGVFSGEITPDQYNDKWWELRERYQGIKPPVSRNSSNFDPGAKYHIVSNVPYARYFYSFIGQFQFHEALCKTAGHQGELYNCDIYKSEKAGTKLRAMLSQGSSKPWRELMKDLTGSEEFCSKSVLEYFKPLHRWLVNENKGRKVGWPR